MNTLPILTNFIVTTLQLSPLCQQVRVISTNAFKEHFPALSTHPHHFHTDQGSVTDSSLTGDPTHDLPFVLNYLTTFIRQS